MPHRSGIVLAMAAALLLGGCKFDLAAMNGNCKKVSGNELRVGRDQACKFNFQGGDYAKYVVVVQRGPIHGDAKGEGKYLRYAPRKGFVGEDRVTIRIERRFAHLQWETRTVTIKVVPGA